MTLEHHPSSIDELLAQAAERVEEMDNIPQAIALAERAAAMATLPVQVARARYWLARCHYVKGDIDVAMTLAGEAHALARQTSHPVLCGSSRALQARCLEGAGEVHEALDQALLALSELEQVPADAEGIDEALFAATIALGVICLTLRDLPMAMSWCERAVELARPLPNRAAYAAALDTVACIWSVMAADSRDRDRRDEAERRERQAIALSTQAVEIARRHGHTERETSALLNLAESLALVGEAAKALSLLRAWDRDHPSAPARQRAHFLDALGCVHLRLGRPLEAAAAHARAAEIVENQVHRAAILAHLAEALEVACRWQEALARFKEFHALQMQLSSDRARRNARVAAMRADIERERARSRELTTHNSQLRRRAEDWQRQAKEDPLTGLANRRHLDAILRSPLSELWWAAIDVDHFKRVNDDHSHATGDAVLRQLATIMRENCRPGDVAGRLGGEEFVLVYRGGRDVDAPQAAERLRATVAAHRWHELAAGLAVTVSIGVAHSSEAVGGDALASLADRRLYRAKQSGRNRVVAGEDG